VLDLAAKEVIIVFPQPHAVLGVAISNGCLAFCAGKSACLLGASGSFLEKPSIVVVSNLLRDAAAFRMVLSQHPSILNFYDTIDRRSFIKDLCVNENPDVIKLALKHANAKGIIIRLYPHSQVEALLDLACATPDRELVRLILDVCKTCPPSSRGALTKCLCKLVAPSR
jgi:hypothetical protein